MAGRVRAGLTPSEGRRFAFPVGAAFLVLAGITWWRDHETLMRVFAGLAGALWLAGALVPGRLGPVYRAWMGLAHAISKVTTPIFMGIVYYLVMTPIGLLRRAVANPIRHEPVSGSFWRDREPGARRGDLERQF